MAISKNEAVKQKIVTGLLMHSTLAEVAESAGITVRTLYNYLHSDNSIARAVKEHYEQVQIDHMEKLSDGWNKAYNAVVSVLEDEKATNTDKLKASTILMNMSQKQNDITSPVFEKISSYFYDLNK